MLTPDGCAGRRQRLLLAQPEVCDALIFSDPNSLRALANFDVAPLGYQAWNAGALLVVWPGKAALIADNVCKNYAHNAYFDDWVQPTFYEGKASAPHREGLLVKAALGFLEGMRWRRFGIEAATAPVGLIEGLRAGGRAVELVDFDPIVRGQRRSKDADEIAILNRSMSAIEAGQRAALREVAPGMTELEAFHRIHRAASEMLGEPARIYGDFAAVPDGRIDRRGGPPTGRTIGSGDLFILDYSVIVGGYRGDFANTVRVGLPPTSQQRDLATACLDAMAAGEALLRPGVAGKDVDAAVRSSLASKGLAQNFSSHVGHGIGLNHLEPPFIVPESTDTLEVGDVLTLEPGQYVDGVGGMRFERNYRITLDGFEILSHHPLGLDAKP